MTELSLENFLMVEIALSSGIFSAIAYLYKGLNNLCERMVKEETKSDIYHSKDNNT